MSGRLEGAQITPTQRIVPEAGAVLSVADGAGHTLQFRRPSALDRLRFFKALGPGLSGNDRYVGYAMLAYCGTGIDDVPIPVPANEAQVEGLVQRLGDVGLVAMGEGMAVAALGTG